MMAKKKYQAYSEMKDSGFDWIGKIPSGWTLKQIKHLSQGSDTLFLDGDWIESKDIVSDDSQIRYITTGNIGEGQYKEQGAGYITEETFNALNCTEVFPGDLVISRLNPPIGRCCIIPDLGRRIVTSVDNVILRPNDKYSKKFLRHALSSHWYYNYTSLIARGATMQRISRGLLGDIKIPIPENIKEQQSISDFLDRKTALIDGLIAKKERMIELLKEKRQATITQAVTKGLDPYVEMDDSGVVWIGKKPKHWKKAPIKHIVSVKVTDGPHETPKLEEDGIPFISAEAVKEGKIDFDKKRGFIDYKLHEIYSKKCKPVKNDIFMVKSGNTTGAVAIVDTDIEFSIWSPLALIRSNTHKVLPLFLYYSLISDYFQANVTISCSYGTQPNIGMGVIENISTLIPPIKEQEVIVNYIKNKVDVIDKLIIKLKQQLIKVKDYRQSLIFQAVTGKIRVS